MADRVGTIRLQWLVMAVFWLSFALNFFDRQLLASAAPLLKAEFHLSNTEYGQLVSAFYLVYALATPFAGVMIDRLGVRAGVAIAVFVWSLASAATGLVQSFRGLLACRMGLGLGESSGFPALGKTTASYLDAAEMGLAGGFGAISIALGSMAAPLVVASLAPQFGWRSVFILSGALGLLWLPLWIFVLRRVPARAAVESEPRIEAREVLRDPRLWSVVLAYCLVYTLYMLWANWTTIYLVEARGLTQAEANARYAWFPPAFAVIGGFLGGSLAFRWIRAGMERTAARLRTCWVTAPLLLLGAGIPYVESTALAAAGIGVSFLALQCWLGSLFLVPLDIFGSRRAGLTNSLLGFAAAGLQVFASPAIGAVIDRAGFNWLCLALPVLPVIGLGILQIALRARPVVPLPIPAQ